MQISPTRWTTTSPPVQSGRARLNKALEELNKAPEELNLAPEELY